jgi:hypothetical protein
MGRARRVGDKGNPSQQVYSYGRRMWFGKRRGVEPVDLHPKLTHLPPIFASKIDPRVTLTPAQRDAGVSWSDRRGFIKCNQTVAPAGWPLNT